MANHTPFPLSVDLIHVVNKLSDVEAGQLAKHIFAFVNNVAAVPPSRIVEVVFEPIRQEIIAFQNRHPSQANHWNWKGGVSAANHVVRTGPQIRAWRKAVFERDNYTCQGQNCGQRGGVLHAHHVKRFAEFPELRFEVSNGLTLCKKCHKKIHIKNG